MKSLSVTIQMETTEHNFSATLFRIINSATLTFKSVDDLLKCDHSNQTKLIAGLALWQRLILFGQSPSGPKVQ